MEFKEVLNSNLFALPKIAPKNKSYRTLIAELFSNYLRIFEQVNESKVSVPGLKSVQSMSAIIQRQRKFIEGLRMTLEIYYDGQPAQAYEIFVKTMDNRIKSFSTLQTLREFEPGESFYRIRTKEENFPFSSSEMFHIPFHLRGRVTTQRYSIPGFPSLYLAKSLYVAWEELKLPNLDKFQAVRLESTEMLRCLDLLRPKLKRSVMDKEAYRYLMIWPLIAACSIKVANPEDSFKPEYILPQLLLQWVRNTGEIDGIMYASTNINLKARMPLKNLYNVVLPVKDNNEDGLCTQLAYKFEMTPAISRQLLNFSSAGDLTFRTEEEISRIDQKIPMFEIIKGYPSHYSNSVIGNLEMILDKMQTEELNPNC
jgi:hypothetical protein